MKNRLIVVVLLIGVFLFAGCAPKTAYRVKDKVTGFPISGGILVNGKLVQVKNGVFYSNGKSFTVEKSGYIQGKPDKNGMVALNPIAYLKIQPTSSIDEVYINGKKYPLFMKDNDIFVSPAPLGKDRVLLKGRFIKDTVLYVQVNRGENIVKANVSVDKEKVSQFLSGVKLFENSQNGTFKINIQGVLDEDNVNYTLNVKVQNGKIVEVSDENVHYKFENGVPLLEEDGKFVEVKDKETATALKYAANVLLNILKIRDYIKQLDVKYITSNKAEFLREGIFENRKFTEHITLYFSGNVVSKAVLKIVSPEIENSNIAVTIERIGR